MFHPIAPGLSGTDGELNLLENASKGPAQKHVGWNSFSAELSSEAAQTIRKRVGQDES
jgi:hypothetical protein